ncbi:MAG: RIP metalloprotease RseP [Taibaiella sp.]|nr:RIP metalloprotease RseP [Taibaiella sp.]
MNTLLLMSGGLMQALQLLAGLSFLIVLHEFGHFFFARLFKTRVEKFYLFFDFLFPFSGLLNFSLFKKTKGDTEYGIGWFPLGGYVKISGMVDESMDKDALALPPEPWEYRSKKPWQRLLIMLGGIIMNVLIAIVLYMISFGIWGDEYLPVKNMKFGISVDSVGRSIGLRNGDMIKAIDEKPIERFNQVPVALIMHKSNGTITINRDGRDTTIKIPFGTISKIIKANRGNVVGIRMPAVIDSVMAGSQAARLQFRKGDSITAINGSPVNYTIDFADYKEANYGRPVTLTYVRDGRVETATANFNKDSLFGCYWVPYSHYMESVKVTYSPVTALGKGVSYTADRLKLYVTQFRLFGSKEVKVNESMGGFYSMGKMYPSTFDWQSFIMLTAFISVALAFMNFLPIPGLDGGYVIFLLFEMITGKKVSEKVMEKATTVGLVILLALMLYVNGLDILRIFKGK